MISAFLVVRGQGTLQEALAVCEMTALQQQVLPP